MSEWRPPDWPYYYYSCPDCDIDVTNIHEAGADAMLAAIWQMAKDSSTGTFVFDSHGMHIFVGRRLENG